MTKEAEALDDAVFDGIVRMCTKMHDSVRLKSVAYLDEMRRHNYVTSTSYLELINVIISVMALQDKRINEKRKRLVVGLDKLKSTKEIVATLQEELAASKPVLEATTIQVKEQQVRSPPTRRTRSSCKRRRRPPRRRRTRPRPRRAASRPPRRPTSREALPRSTRRSSASPSSTRGRSSR